MSDIVYDKYGNHYIKVEVEDDKCLVQMGIADPEDLWRGNLTIYPKDLLNEKPPISELEEQVSELQKKIRQLDDLLRNKRRELKSYEKQFSKRLETLKKYDALKRLEDFLDGKITHYVEYEYGPPTIIAFADTESEYKQSYRPEMKLLTLFGRTDTLEWRLNQYSDGSGGNTTVIPCTSYDEALNIVADMLTTHEKEALNSESSIQPSRNWIELTKKYNMVLCDNYLKLFGKRKEENRRKKIVKLQTELADLQNEDV